MKLIFNIIMVLTIGQLYGQSNAITGAEREWVLESNSINEIFRPYLGNGYMGIKIAGEGTTWESDHQLFVSDVWRYDAKTKEWDGDTEKICPVPKWTNIGLFNGSSYFNKNNGAITNYRQTQNMKHGYIRTLCTWTSDGKTIDIDIIVYVSRENPNFGSVRYKITPRFQGTIKFDCVLDGNNLIYEGYFDRIESMLEEEEKGVDEENHLIWLHTSNNIQTHIGNALINRLRSKNKEDVTYSYRQENKKITQTISINTSTNQEYILESFATVYSGEEMQNVALTARKECLINAEAGWAKPFERHRQKWEDIWKSDIIIKGSDVFDDQQRMRSAFFNLLQSFSEERSVWGGYGPTGLSEGRYHGLIHWDADYWAWTPIAIIHRNFAKPLTEYRWMTREGAKTNAIREGRSGYKWAWKSGHSGIENVTPALWQQIHIGGWVSLMFWNYYLLTGDLNWLKEKGFPVMKETCKYWEQRVIRNFEKERFEVVNSTPALEQGMFDHDMLTSVLIWRNMVDVTTAATLVGEKPEPIWKKIADEIYLPFDDEQQIYLQYEGYNGHNTDAASAELGILPLEYPMPHSVKKSMMDYYIPRFTATEPIVPYGAFGMILSELGEKDRAWEMFKFHYEKGAHGPFQIWTETVSRPTWNYFLQSAGSYLQQVIYGFAGIRIRHDGIHFHPALPVKWDTIKLTNIEFGSATYDITITKGDNVILKRTSGVADIAIYNKGGEKIN